MFRLYICSKLIRQQSRPRLVQLETNFAAVLKLNIKQKYCNAKYPTKILFKLALRKGDSIGKSYFEEKLKSVSLSTYK